MAHDRLVGLGVVFCLTMACASTVSAQSRTSSGTFGSRSLGGGVTGSSQNRNQGITQTGQISSDAAIQRQTGGFVGADASDVSSIRSLGGANAGRGGGGFGTGGFGSFGTGGFGQQGSGQQRSGQNNRGGQGNDPRQNLRTPMRLGFTPAKRLTSQISVQLASRLTKIPQLDLRHGTIVVQMEGRTAVLRGVVSSDHQRGLAARLALFEPGVSAVRNELVVQAAPEPLEPLPLPAQSP